MSIMSFFMHVESPIKDTLSGVEYTHMMIQENYIDDTTIYVICTSDEIECEDC